jgi:Meckel syndrome type 1 protein
VKGAKPNHSRPQRSVNVGRLGEALGLDVLGAAMGLTDEAVNIVIQGRGHAREDQYFVHLVQRLKDAGLPKGWTEQDEAPLLPEYLKALREFAAASDNKAPIRRANFKRLAKAFNGRTEVLAEALQMVAPSIANVAEGRLEFDDGRAGHLNPRLMEAGFPDGWLEQAEPELTDAMLTGLESLANEEAEQELAARDDDLKHTEGQAFVGGSSTTSVQPVAAPVDTSQETVMATSKSTPAAKPTFNKPTSTFAAAGMPGASRPMAHPTAAGAKLPRTVMAGGRPIGGAKAVPAAKKTTAAPAAAPAAPAAKTAAAVPAAKKAAPSAAKKTTAPAKNAPAHTAHAAPAPAPAPAAEAADSTKGREGVISKEASIARAEAVDKLLNGTRRGVKVTLWRDILGKGLPYWGNIRRGAVLFHDDLAARVEEAMGLPKGWADNPSFPPTSLAEWVVNPEEPIPTLLEAHAGVQGASTGDAAAAAPAAAPAAAKATYPRPYARKTAPRPPLVTTTKAPTSAPVLKAPVFTPPNQGDLLADTHAAQPAAQTQTPAAAAQPAPQPAVPSVAAPAPAAVAPAGAHSPMVTALLALIEARSAAGALPDATVMQLIHTLSAA